MARSLGDAQKWFAQAAANPRASSSIKERARKRYSDLAHAREEMVEFEGGRFKGLRTITRAECASACSLIFVAGTERVLVGPRARIGLHQPASVHDYDKSRRCASGYDGNGVSEISKFLRWAVPDTADRIMDIALGTSCDSIEWIHGQRVLELAIATRLEAADPEMLGQTKR